ncbi:MAG: DedA family protein [Candidatus Pacearchaeota archaeon]|nr:DedA family protein [Candidatus Pacearchaeota archaeon]
MLEIISSLIDSLILFIGSIGYLGIFIGMTIESSFFPLPSEIVLIPAGILIAKGEMNFFLAFIAGVLGSIAGAWINYSLALFLGRKTFDFFIAKYGKFLFIGKEEIRKTENYFKEHGEITTFTGRLIPVVRHLISLPAGFSRMNAWKFTFFTALGASVYTIFILGVGYFFGSNAQPVLKIVTGVFLVIIFGAITIYYLRNKKKK